MSRHRSQFHLAVAFVAVLALALVAAAPSSAAILQQGTGYCNQNFNTVTLTYSWSGHFGDGNEVCVLPKTINVAPGQCVFLTPPAGFTVSDFIVISRVLRGQELGGYTICDPPGKTLIRYFDIPCGASGEPVHAFAFIGGDGDLGPFFANVPLTLGGFEEDGSPIVVRAKVDPVTQQPVTDASAEHCLAPADADPVVVENEVVSTFEAQTLRQTCGRVTIGPPPVGFREPPERQHRRQ